MAIRNEMLTQEEASTQVALTRSWVGARSALADPAFRTRLERSIARLNESDSSAVLTREEFLAQTDLDA